MNVEVIFIMFFYNKCVASLYNPFIFNSIKSQVWYSGLFGINGRTVIEDKKIGQTTDPYPRNLLSYWAIQQGFVSNTSVQCQCIK